MYDTTDDKAAKRADARSGAGTTATALAAEQAESELVYLPLNKLDFDSDNVRKRGGENVDALKALILSQDLLQNLIVCPLLTKRGKPTGKFGVVAGARRLRALRALAEEGKIAGDKEILCLVKPRAQAVMASAAENSGREAMTGPDTIIAFASMAREGKGVEELALAFGISEVTVRRRLKLANVSPKLFDLYAQEQISLDQLMALAVIDDHERQEAIWEGASEYHRGAAQLKRAALGQAVSAASDRFARFVGVDAYVAAGGQLLADLFADDDRGHMTDPDLLSRLANDKLGREREQLLATGVSWVEFVENYDYSARQDYVEAPTTTRAPKKVEKKAIDAAKLKYASARQAMQAFQDDSGDDDEDEGLYTTLDTAIDDAKADVDELLDQLKSVAPEVQALCGVVLTVEPSGQLRKHRNLVRKQDAKKAASVARTAEGGSTTIEDEPGSGLSDALQRRLSAQKTVAVQVELALNAQVAMAVLAYTLMSDLNLCGDGYLGSNITGRNRDRELKLADPSIESSKAWIHLESLVATIRAILPEDEDNLLSWLIEQPLLTLVQILSLCTALTVYNGTTTLRHGAGNLIPGALGLDMADYWCATGDTYFKSVPKALIAEAIAEVDPERAQGVDKLKKGEAVALAESALKDSRWLPAALRRVTAG